MSDHDDSQPLTLGEFKRLMAAHEVNELNNITAQVNALRAEAFYGTPTEHKATHKAMMDAVTAQKEFWDGLKVDVAKKSIWGILQILVVLICAGLAVKLGFGFTVLR